MSLVPTRRYNAELMNLLDKTVTVVTTSGKSFTGTLVGFESTNRDLCLSNVKDERGESYTRVFVYGHSISVIYTKERLLNLKELAERLEKYFPRMVKYLEESRAILVMDRIRVTEEGVEGSGPMAEKVRRIYYDFLKEKGLEG